MKWIGCLCSLLFVCQQALAGVEKEKMKQIYEESVTPYKYGLVMAPQTNMEKYDCPMIFREGGKWYMTYVCYNGKSGTDGRGYETWLAESPDLLHWTTLGRILEFAPKGCGLWDENQRGGFPALIDYNWGGSYKMEKYKGKHWITYIGGHGTGYEGATEPLSIGVATTKKDISTPHPWTCEKKPLMSYNDKDAQWWEHLIQYKSTIYRVDRKYFGYPFVMYYNAGGMDETHPKGERIGIALSKDMKNWKRYEGNPVFAHDSEGTITGDAQLVKMGDVFVMYYFSAYNPTRKYKAYNTFAASYDLINWTDWEGADLIIPSKPYDEMFAHKSYVIKHDGVVYHFYCAVNNAGQRGIALATSKHLGKSEVSFPEPDPSGQRLKRSLNENWTVTNKDRGTLANVTVPFNLDDYYGTLQKEHGNLHGDAKCIKKFFLADIGGKECFIRFEGVGTYAEVILNGNNLGRYDIGRTTQTIDITKYVIANAENTLQLNISHPEGITDMPWVCGGCSSEWGFSEGSQPFGIFRPVMLEITDKVRIEPFGVHVWSNEDCDSLFVESEVKNYSDSTVTISLINRLRDDYGKQLARYTTTVTLQAGEMKVVCQKGSMQDVKLNRWSIDNPYLYTINTLVKRNGKTTDSEDTPFGFRTVKWPINDTAHHDNCFRLNGEKTFINGVCEYEHILGQSHAFTNEQIEARVNQVISAGFNAFRDAHQPHNLYYKTLIDNKGLLWWTQFSAHIWYDTPQFRESFKRHLRQWVKERRNSPSLILWGLQNESTLPKDFAEECTQIIRQMDPTCGSQRLVTTCNGGEGTDWNVVQNWSGTYGGNIDNYANELKKPDQLLNGEYGAWRTIGNHTGEGYTEEKFCDILKKKVQLAESARDSVCGQFLWLLASHDNPGRRQPDEALRKIDKIGPFNNKGLFTIWGQPTDAFYMFKQSVANSQQPGLAPRPLLKERELKTQQPTINNQWSDELPIGTKFLLNCGGDRFVDADGRVWEQDVEKISDNQTYYSTSWGDRFEKISSYQCSQTYSPELPLPELFQRNRFGRHELKYHFKTQPGQYTIVLYFVEPWYKGNHDTDNYEGWRLFDVAVNDSTVIRDLDIWAQVGYGKVYKRVIHINNVKDEICISFPRVKSGQAIISAIAIYDSQPSRVNSQRLSSSSQSSLWSSFDNDIMVKTPDSLLPAKTMKPIEAEPVMIKERNGKKDLVKSVEYTFSVGVAKVYALRFKYHNSKQPRKLHAILTDQNGVVYFNDDVSFLQTQEKITKRKMTSITTHGYINAGTYKIVLSGEGITEMLFDSLFVE